MCFPFLSLTLTSNLCKRDIFGIGAIFANPHVLGGGLFNPGHLPAPLFMCSFSPVVSGSSMASTKAAVDHSGTDTVFMVIVLVSVVGGVFVLFALMALCYRSVVVHSNLSLCLRLVLLRRATFNANHMSIYLTLFLHIHSSAHITLSFQSFLSVTLIEDKGKGA